jgi:hypothetical protein
MRRGFVLTCLLLTAAACPVRADIPPGPHIPRPLPAPPAPPPAPAVAALVVEPSNGEDRQTRLRLPRTVMKHLGAAVSSGTVEEATSGWAPTPTGTAVAGAAISVAVVMGGLWMIRRPKRRWIGAGVTAATVVVMLGLAGCIPGQVSPWMVHQEEERLPRLKPETDGTLVGRALLETGDADDSSRLIIDREDLAAWAAKAATQPVDSAADSGPTKK